MTERVRYERHGSVAEALLSGRRANALNAGLARDLRAALDTAEDDPDVTCFVITSGGRNFCTGADTALLDAVSPDPTFDAAYQELGEIYGLFAALQGARIPTLAAVGGHVIGAGINLALSCDVRVVGDDVRIRGFGAAQVHPGGGHLSMLLRNLAPGAAAAIALFNQELDAAGALACGFAQRTAPPGDLRAAALELGEAMGNDGPLVRAVTASYRESRAAPLTADTAIMLERAAQMWSLRRRAGSR
jgi:enoyl-CoA hydratase